MYICAHCRGTTGRVWHAEVKTLFMCYTCGKRTWFLEDNEITVDPREERAARKRLIAGLSKAKEANDAGDGD